MSIPRITGPKVRSEINDIRRVGKWGAYGDPEKFGLWIYGRRPDGRTVACKHGMDKDGNYWVASEFEAGKFLDAYVSEFSPKEWGQIFANQDESGQKSACNEILRKRRVAEFLARKSRSEEPKN